MKFSRTVIRNAKAAEAALRLCQKDELSITRTAVELGASTPSVAKWCAALGITPWWSDTLRKLPESSAKNAQRDHSIVEDRAAGMTLLEIGKKHGVTRERVRQIVLRERPEVVLPKYVRASPLCKFCGNPFHRTPNIQYHCSLVCKQKSHQKFTYDRDLAEKIMEMRDQGKTWQQVTDALRPEMPMLAFYSSIRKHVTRIFSTAERERYFRKNTPRA